MRDKKNSLISWFDYVYFRIYDIYQNKWHDSMPWIYALTIVSITQSFFLLSIPIIYGIITQTKLGELGVSKYYFALLAYIILGLNYFRYKWIIPYSLMLTKWKGESKNTRKKRGRLVVLFIILSICIFFGVAVIAGMINNNQL